MKKPKTESPREEFEEYCEKTSIVDPDEVFEVAIKAFDKYESQIQQLKEELEECKLDRDQHLKDRKQDIGYYGPRVNELKKQLADKDRAMRKLAEKLKEYEKNNP